MIRHANRGASQAVDALAIAVIESSFFGLLVTAIGLAQLKPAGLLATGIAAIDLSPLTLRADEKENAATRRAAKALPEWSVTLIRHF